MTGNFNLEKYSRANTSIAQEYVLIDQSQVYIEQYCKLANKRWSYSQYDEEDGGLVFSFFQVEVPLAELYEKVDVEAQNEPEEGGEE